MRTGTFDAAQLVGAAQFRKIDDKAGGQHLGAELAQEFDRAFRRAAGRDQVVDQNDALAFRDGILMHLHFVDAVFQRIADGDALERQLAFLADRHEAAET